LLVPCFRLKKEEEEEEEEEKDPILGSTLILFLEWNKV